MEMMQAMGYELTITWERHDFDVTTFGSTAKTYLAGDKEWTIVAKNKSGDEARVKGKDLQDVYAKILKEVLA